MKNLALKKWPWKSNDVLNKKVEVKIKPGRTILLNKWKWKKGVKNRMLKKWKWKRNLEEQSCVEKVKVKIRPIWKIWCWKSESEKKPGRTILFWKKSEKKLYKIFGYEKVKVKKKPGRTILCWKPSSSRQCGGIWRPTTIPGTGLDNISIIITPLKNKSVPTIQNLNPKYGCQQQHLGLDLTTYR